MSTDRQQDLLRQIDAYVSSRRDGAGRIPVLHELVAKCMEQVEYAGGIEYAGGHAGPWDAYWFGEAPARHPTRPPEAE